MAKIQAHGGASRALGVAIASRVALLLWLQGGLWLVPDAPRPPVAKPLTADTDTSRVFTWGAVDGLVRWDSAWYFDIARRGYVPARGGESNVAFFPLFPYLSKAISVPLRLGLDEARAFYLAGVLLSHLCFVLAMVGLARLVRRLEPGANEARVVLAFAVAPFSYFFSAAYSEALFLALAVWSYERAERGQFSMAFALSAFAVWTRAPGVLVPMMVALELLRQRAYRDRTIVWAGLPVLAGVLLLVFYASVAQDPLAFLSVQGQGLWLRSFGLPPFDELWALLTHPEAPLAIKLAYGPSPLIIVGGLVLGGVVLRRYGVALGVFTIASMLLIALSGSWLSVGRLASVVFPLWLVVAVPLTRTGVLIAYLGLALPLLGYYAFQFAHWNPPF